MAEKGEFVMIGESTVNTAGLQRAFPVQDAYGTALHLCFQGGQEIEIPLGQLSPAAAFALLGLSPAGVAGS